MLRIKEVEMADSLEEFKSSRSVEGEDFPNFEMLDARNVFALIKIIQNSQFKKKVSLEEQQAKRGPVSTRKTDRFHDLRLSSDWRSWYSIGLRSFFCATLHNDYVQEFDTRRDEVLLSTSEIPSEDILESLLKLIIRESA